MNSTVEQVNNYKDLAEVIIMKKTFILEDLDCANCAAKIEKAVQALDGVNTASVNFMTTKMVLDIDDATDEDDLIKKIKKIVKKTEPDCKLKQA